MTLPVRDSCSSSSSSSFLHSPVLLSLLLLFSFPSYALFIVLVFLCFFCSSSSPLFIRQAPPSLTSLFLPPSPVLGDRKGINPADDLILMLCITRASPKYPRKLLCSLFFMVLSKSFWCLSSVSQGILGEVSLSPFIELLIFRISSIFHICYCNSGK